ncbi:glycosyltransferase [Maricaulis sp.]|uniref:glycosyltransferase family 2 protein n=1 Tax=unclassified Maricaulis TaxID=2632371 RepID=UPI001B06CCB6|nr:glycosyltransferase [Maricaulis sp.]MBO6798551.1 glycosyltransferase [Maricaulis sp.]
MISHPTISVVMPVFNARATITKAVLSVQAQTFRNWELILVDDGSSDDTLEIALGLEALDERIRVTAQENAGPAAARNVGIKLSRGRLIAFLDADDHWHRDRLGACLAHFSRNPHVGVVYTRVALLDGDGQAARRPTPHFDVLTPAQLLSENPVCTTSNIVVRTSVIEQVGDFDPRMAHIEDQDFLFRVASKTSFTLEGIDRVLLDYRVSDQSRSADLALTAKSWRLFMARARAIAPQLVDPIWRGLVADFHRNQARRALRSGLPATALALIARACSADPLIFCRMPWRVGLTLLAALAMFLPIPRIKEYVR